MNQESKPHDRRAFIKKVAFMGGAGTLLAAAGKTGRAAARPHPTINSAAGSPRGYRVTAHIRKYYEKAAF